jgi:septal ring factor EnvC (AmiA/AmiB activator)
MFMETPQDLLMITGGAFLLGWFVGKVGAYFGNKYTANQRDPRDDRIRSLEAELRIAKTEADKAQTELATRDKELTEARRENGDMERHLTKQEEVIVALRKDLRDSVIKTRELREELTDRATENLKSEVKLREVETELSVAQASTDLLATGVLDYTVEPESDDDESALHVYNAES